MARPGKKRFYATAATAERNGLLFVELDGKPMRTPAKQPFVLPAEALASAIAEEWQAQADMIVPATMPLTKLANTAIDGVATRMEEVAADVLRFAASDLICYRAASPAELAGMQASAWDPVLAWSASHLKAPLRVGEGLKHVPQSPASLDAIGSAVKPLDAFALTAVHTMTAITGSAVLTLAHIRGRLTLEEAWDAASVDDNWQSKRWGKDSEAERRRAGIWNDVAAASRFYTLSRPREGSAKKPSGTVMGCAG